MKLTIKTAKFQEMVAKAAKGASENKLLPLTNMILIELSDHVLRLTTTDTENTLTVRTKDIAGDDFYAVVPVDKFAKLIAKSTSESITLTLKDSVLEVKSNGTYNIELTVDEAGLIKFPEYLFEKKGKGLIVNLSSIKAILAINKPALSKKVDAGCMGGYYLSDKVITSDEDAICFNTGLNLVNESILMSPDMMELLALNTEEKIRYFHTGNYFLFETDEIVIHGPEYDGKDQYPVEEISDYLDVAFPSMCKLPKLLLQSVIDRLSLFIEPYDKNGAYFTFTRNGVKLYSKKSSSVETIAYSESKEFQPFTCVVDIPMLKSQIDANPGEQIELHYGHQSAIKLVYGNIVQVLSLLEDDLVSASNGADTESES